jgi:hypothetical protein
MYSRSRVTVLLSLFLSLSVYVYVYVGTYIIINDMRPLSNVTELDARVLIRTHRGCRRSVIDFSCLNYTNGTPTSVPACHNHKYATAFYGHCPCGWFGRRIYCTAYSSYHTYCIILCTLDGLLVWDPRGLRTRPNTRIRINLKSDRSSARVPVQVYFNIYIYICMRVCV